MKTIQTILSFVLVAAVVMTSISHSVSFHFCAGRIESVAFFGKAKSCTEHANSCDRDSTGNHHSLRHKGCCQDTSFAIDTDKYFSKITDQTSVESSQDLVIPVTYLAANDSGMVESANVTIYKPPLFERDITILMQTFLI